MLILGELSEIVVMLAALCSVVWGCSAAIQWLLDPSAPKDGAPAAADGQQAKAPAAKPGKRPKVSKRKPGAQK